MKSYFKDMLGFTEVGGIGEISYRSVRFHNYRVKDKNGFVLMYPDYQKGDTLVDEKRDRKLTGQRLLTSLCNLYQEMNDPDCKLSPTDMVIDWCTENMHPYNIDMIYEQCIEDYLSYEMHIDFLKRDGAFIVQDFIRDLQELYNATCFYYALTQLSNGKRNPALRLNDEGRLSEGLPFFEKYKLPRPQEGFSQSTKPATWYDFIHMDSTLEEMIASNEIQPPPAKIAPEKRTFMQNPLKDLDYLHEMLMSLFPEFKMKLQKNSKTKRITFAADIRSVFDICWFALARLVADDTPKDDEDPYSNYREASILCCLNCGNFFVRTGPRQKYCKDEDCQAARQRNNQRSCRTRKKIQEQQKD